VQEIDGTERNGFNVRLARYLAQSPMWVWLNLFLQDGRYAFHDDALPRAGLAGVTDTAADDVTYAQGGDVNVRLRPLGTQAATRRIAFTERWDHSWDYAQTEPDARLLERWAKERALEPEPR